MGCSRVGGDPAVRGHSSLRSLLPASAAPRQKEEPPPPVAASSLLEAFPGVGGGEDPAALSSGGYHPFATPPSLFTPPAGSAYVSLVA